MKIKDKQINSRPGAALILVVVVTVLLAAIGVMFVMTSRLSEMETTAVADQQDLNAAVDTIVGRIDEVLVEDLFADDNIMVNADSLLSANGYDPDVIYADELFDYPIHHSVLGADGITDTVDDVIDPGPDNVFNDITNLDDVWIPGQVDDCWLASLEPVFNDNGTPATWDDFYEWRHITDLWGSIEAADDSLFFQQYDSGDHHKFFQYNPGVFWLDPDDDTVPGQWANGQAVRDAYQVSAYNVVAKVIESKDRVKVIQQGATGTTEFPDPWDNPTYTMSFGARADADGDGVADSRWVKVPGMTTSRGKDVFAAVRIIDNCAMLNLNAAYCFYQEDVYDSAQINRISSFETPWNYFEYNAVTTRWEITPYYDSQKGVGRYLTEVNYFPFLRGHDLNESFFDGDEIGDDWFNLMLAKGQTDFGTIFDPIGGKIYTNQDVPYIPEDTHNALMNIEDIDSTYPFFDVGEELELRNRYLLTSNVESRFERKDVANYTLDSGSTDYAALKVPRDNSGYPVSIWYERIEQANFDEWSDWLNPTITTPIPYKYDRRHVCTFYSYDRPIRHGKGPLSDLTLIIDSWTPQQIANIPQVVFWYPLLYSEIKAYADANYEDEDYAKSPDYQLYLWDVWESIFTPKGAITTNIETPLINYKYDDTNPSILHPFSSSYNNVETRRKILHLLYAFREYYYQHNGNDPAEAAKSAAQVVANIIDFSDDDATNTQISGETEGPFYATIYGEQANVDCTFITEQIIEDIITEVSEAILGSSYGFTIDFQLDETVFGYERQPFISEVYAYRNPDNGGALEGFAIELLNPYSAYPEELKLYRGSELWKIKIGDGSVIDAPIGSGTTTVSQYDDTNKTPGRYVIRSGSTVSTVGIPYDLPDLLDIDGVTNKEIQLLRPAPVNSGVQFIVVDQVSSQEVNKLWLADNQSAIKRQDTKWKFVYPSYELQQEDATPPNYTHTLGQANGVNLSALDDKESFQLAVADDEYPLCRWHELETLSLYGNGLDSTDPNSVITVKLTNNTPKHFDLDPNQPDNSSDLLNYLCTMNRPDLGTLPGRININTAPVHVIAAAIPPSLVDPSGGGGFSALDFAQAIVYRRENVGPYEKLSDLLTISPGLGGVDFQSYVNDPNTYYSAGQPSIEDNIEERDWILSNLANKFTVRSDVFTAYILVRLGEDGPQRRMIAIFDRSNVWKPTDRPKLVALHPVPDPR
jgi:hypothetical protein